MTAGHGPNLGHGYTKYIVIDQAGAELAPVVFPAVTARAGRQVSGALVRTTTIEANGERWWVGEDALLSPSPLTLLAQEANRLSGAMQVWSARSTGRTSPVKSSVARSTTRPMS